MASLARLSQGEATHLPSMKLHRGSEDPSACGDGIWLTGRDLWHLESVLGICNNTPKAPTHRFQDVVEEARNVHLKCLALENAILSAVLELEGVLGIERPTEHSLTVQERFQG